MDLGVMRRLGGFMRRVVGCGRSTMLIAREGGASDCCDGMVQIGRLW